MRGLLLSASLLFVLTGSQAQVSGKATSLLYYQQYNSAEQLLKEAIDKGTKDDDAVYLLVKTYLLQHKTAEAGALLNDQYVAVTDKRSISPYTKTAYVWYLLENKKQEEAQAIVDELLQEKKNKKNSLLLCYIAESYLQSKSGLVQPAIDLLQQAAERDSKNPAIYTLTGDAYRQLSDGGKAVQSYNKALEVDPSYAKAKFAIGKVYVSQQNSGIFLNEFFQAEQMDSTYAPTYYELYYYYYFKDVSLAKKYLTKYIQHTEHTPELDYTMTDLLYVSGEYEQAINDAQKLLDSQKEKAEPRLYKLIAYCYDTLGKKSIALEYINKYFQQSPEKNYVAKDYELKARLIATDTTQLQEAIGLYTKAVELDTLANNKAKYMMAIVDLHKNMHNQAAVADWMGKIYAVKPDATNMDLYNWGVACFATEDYRLSDSVFALYTDKYPEHIHGFYWRAKCNALIDTAMTEGLAIPFYEKVAAIGETDATKYKAMLTRSYGYLGSYHANVDKNYEKSLEYFEKYLQLEPGNKEIEGYAEVLNKRIEAENKNSDQKNTDQHSQ